jgi:uncharacterized protein YbaP (TraB family)
LRRSHSSPYRFGRGWRPLASTLCWALCFLALGAAARADTALHSLWELHGKHNTVYLLGSIHVLRPSDYPLPAAVQDAYRNAASLVMEINLADIDAEQVQAQMLSSALLPEGKSLPQVMGQSRYARAQSLTRDLGFELSTFDLFAPWFAAEAISQLQLAQIGFEPKSGVEMHFLDLARADGKSVAGLETVHDQIALFENMSMDAQVEYLMSSLEQARDLPKEVDGMVHAWQRGDTNWFETQLKSELGNDPAVYESLVVARNRKWIARIEAMLADDKNYLVIVGTAHLVGRDSVIDLLKRDGIGATQR